MIHTIAKKMLVGKTYTGTKECPMEMEGKTFTVLKIEDFGTVGEPEERDLLNFTIDVEGQAFSDVIFAPGDVVEDRNLPDLGWIKSNVYTDQLVCDCGNDPIGEGFTGLSITRSYEPGPRSDSGLIICQSCGRIIDCEDLEANHDATDEDRADGLKYRVRVVGFAPIPENFHDVYEMSTVVTWKVQH